ncbi:DUF423 domain-containing protein [Galbibacter pacificus]|uniref:DUF423 domain-containing protein n=1 Tax=Galbibacter pacificus TaxID=2996052 RepID=A0ABT6FSH4_9FLAO|nr:DUF423 domain-containing protein [Galbibacter pacificus]MDG3582685.1 DUF423 domain-containing protein [Galbibacter pacificus]MDG3586196.1 DUF423 domain-containing protein [Galbibacter pacificus]
MTKGILIAGAILGFLAVILGAFGAHALKNAIDAEAIKTFETGVKYQMYHALLLLFVGSTTFLSEGTKNTIMYLVILGVVLFSGSIYGLATNSLTPFDFKKIGFITPIGGTLLIVSWGILIYKFVRLKI